MSKERKFIPVEESFAKWREEPEFLATYDALDDEFSLAAALIDARASANLTQEELARRMGTTQPVIARMEGGKVMPSSRTLAKLARATGTRLRITFEASRSGGDPG